MLSRLRFACLLSSLSALAAVACSSGPGASGDAGAPDSVAPSDAAPDAAADSSATDAGDTTPITAPADTWSWVDFPESKCGSGSPTGIGINPHAGSTDVVLYFQGGGHCATGDTCWPSNDAALNASFMDGYDGSTFAKFGPPAFPLLDRKNAQNPLANANLVYIPYCTGDLHTGTVEKDLPVNGTTKPTYFWGGTDLGIFLSRLVPTFAGANHVVLLGASAGGYGTFLSFDRVSRAFPSARVDVIDDSGPPILAPNATKNGLLAYYGYATPAGCTSPCDDYGSIVSYDLQSHPTTKLGFLLYEEDSSLWQDLAYPTIQAYGAAIDAFYASVTGPNEAVFLVKNEQAHVVENDSDPGVAAAYLPWVTDMLSGSPGWGNLTYTHP